MPGLYYTSAEQPPTVYEIISSRPPYRYRIITTRHPLIRFAEEGYLETGIETGKHLRPELQGQPKFKGLCGPMWGGRDDKGRPVIRYEDQKTYDSLSM